MTKGVKEEKFLPFRTKIHAVPSLTARTASLMHALGGTLLLAGFEAAAFYTLCVSLITHLLDSSAHHLLNFIGGKKTYAIAGAFPREDNPHPRCLFVLSPRTGEESGKRKLTMYRVSLLGGAALLAFSTISLLTGWTSAPAVALLSSLSLAGLAGGGIWSAGKTPDEAREIVARIADRLAKGGDHFWVFALPDSKYPLLSSLLRKYRAMLLPVPVVIVSFSPALPRGSARVCRDSSGLLVKSKGGKLAEKAAESLRESGFHAAIQKKHFQPDLRYASSRGFHSISISFSIEEDPIRCADTLRSLFRSLAS